MNAISTSEQNQRSQVRSGIGSLLGGLENSIFENCVFHDTNLTLTPGQVWITNDMGNTSQQPQASAIGSICTIHKTAEGEFVIAGDETLLRDIFENDPEQWLRCLALKGTKNGKTKK